MSCLCCFVQLFSSHSITRCHIVTLFQDDEEWDDYRENKKDYSGLKIETLVIEDVGAKQEEEETEVRAATGEGPDMISNLCRLMRTEK